MADNKSIQKVFSLSDFRKKQLLGEVPQRTRETYREYGYFGGGLSVASRSTIDRIDYTNDTATASVRGPLTSTMHSAGSCGNINFGYFGGGSPGTRVERIDYSNDLVVASIKNNLNSPSRNGVSASGNSNFGYFSGGSAKTIIDRIDYSNDIAAVLVRGPLSASRSYHGATGNSNFGYAITAFSPNLSSYDRINYSNDTVAAVVRGSLASSGYTKAATGNSSFGYTGGGQGSISTVNRIDFSNDTRNAILRGPLSLGRLGLSATGNSNFGYFGGGFPAISTVDRIDYSSDTNTASARGPLSLVRYWLSATSSHSFGGSPNSSFASNFTFPTVPNAGYFGGGSDGTNNLATIDKVDYANDTSTASVRSALSSAKIFVKSVNNNNFGYYNGATTYPATSSTIDRIEFSSDTQNAVVRGPLSIARNRGAATGNSNFGYFGGGYAPGNSSTIDRIDYSNDNATASNRSLLSLARRDFSATGNQNFGYFGGGFSSVAVPVVDRLDYSNDTLNALSRGGIITRYDNMAVGNNNFGYFGGGTPGISSVDRIDYSNDTQTASVRGPLSSGRGASTATGNNNFGYIGGGTVPSGPPIYYSTTDRINYSNDTAIASIRGPLSTAKSSLAATSPLAYGGAPIYFTNPLPEVLQKQIIFNDANTLDLPFKRALGSYGYYVGGSTPASQFASTVERIDYSNDLINPSIRGSLSSGRYSNYYSSTSNFGFVSGGRSGNVIPEKIDFSNDTSRPKIITSGDNKYGGSSVGNDKFGYYAGGTTSPAGSNWFSTITRIDFSNDNSSGLPRGLLSLARNVSVGTGNQNFGYFGGGVVTGSVFSVIDRINYSNDTSIALVRGPLSLSKYGVAATGNQNFGYFGGGYNSTLSPSSARFFSTIDRINYSNDTQAAIIRGGLNQSKYLSSATGNSNFGYFSGGIIFGNIVALIERIDYSNDTFLASNRSNLSVIKHQGSSITNARNS